MHLALRYIVLSFALIVYVPGLAVAEDPAADADWLERLAEGARRYSPAVALDPPQGLVLDSAGADHLFGGERGLAEDIETRMARRGITVRLAYGDTPEAARALARHAGTPAPDEMGAIRRLPAAALELDEDACAALMAAGLKSVGDVLARPMATIAARFGREAATALRRLTGEERVQRIMDLEMDKGTAETMRWLVGVHLSGSMLQLDGPLLAKDGSLVWPEPADAVWLDEEPDDPEKPDG